MLSSIADTFNSITAFYVVPLRRKGGFKMRVRAILREVLAQVIVHAIFHVLFAPVAR